MWAIKRYVLPLCMICLVIIECKFIKSFYFWRKYFIFLLKLFEINSQLYTKINDLKIYSEHCLLITKIYTYISLNICKFILSSKSKLLERFSIWVIKCIEWIFRVKLWSFVFLALVFFSLFQALLNLLFNFLCLYILLNIFYRLNTKNTFLFSVFRLISCWSSVLRLILLYRTMLVIVFRLIVLRLIFTLVSDFFLSFWLFS